MTNESKDCANQIFWWQKFTQQCKAKKVKKGIYMNPSTGEHMSGSESQISTNMFAILFSTFLNHDHDIP